MNTSHLRRVAASGALLAASAAVATAGPAQASPLAPGIATGSAAGHGQPANAAVSWSVMPATATTPQTSRAKFSYVEIKPGTTIYDHVAVINRSARTVAFTIYATDASGITPQNALTLLPAAKQPVDIGSWITFPHHVSRLSVIIPGHKGVIEPFTLAVPHSATPGDHTGGMIASVSFERHGPKRMVTVDERVAVPIEMRVTGPVHPGLRVQSISASFNGTLNPFGDGTATVSYTLFNWGNVRLAGSQLVSVTGPFGITARAPAGRLPTVLPGDSVRMTVRTAGLYPAGPLTAHVSVSPADPPKALPLSQPLAVQNGTASLFAVPWSAIGLLILLVGAGVGGWQAWRWRRRRVGAALVAVATQARQEAEERLRGGSAEPASRG